MKLVKLYIENYRGIEKEEFNFTDSLSRTLQTIVITGDADCGKTSVLEAISICSGKSVHHYHNDALSIVRKGTTMARISAEYECTYDEVHTIPGYEKGSESVLVCVEWTYSCETQKEVYTYSIKNGEALFHFRDEIQYGRTKDTDELLQRIGGVYSWFQYQEKLSQYIYTQLSQDIHIFSIVRDMFCDLYSNIVLQGITCNLLGEYDCVFQKNGYSYVFSDLSESQKIVFCLLAELITERLYHSIVLIDNFGRYLHPTLQGRLYYVLTHMSRDNQLIITTQSEYLLDHCVSQVYKFFL